VPSVGYAFWQTRNKLKEEYKSLQGKEIAALKKQGTVVTEDVVDPLFVFTGDTSIKLFETNNSLFDYPVIITGMIKMMPKVNIL
jgi:hypothetical protein